MSTTGARRVSNHCYILDPDRPGHWIPSSRLSGTMQSWDKVRSWWLTGFHGLL